MDRITIKFENPSKMKEVIEFLDESTANYFVDNTLSNSICITAKTIDSKPYDNWIKLKLSNHDILILRVTDIEYFFIG